MNVARLPPRVKVIDLAHLGQLHQGRGAIDLCHHPALGESGEEAACNNKSLLPRDKAPSTGSRGVAAWQTSNDSTRSCLPGAQGGRQLPCLHTITGQTPFPPAACSCFTACQGGPLSNC